MKRKMKKRLSQKTYGLFRQPIIFFSASFLRKKLCFFLKNDALKEFLWAAHNDEGVMRQPPFFMFCNHLGFGCQLLVVRRTTNN
jgi:hypothetical protein